MYRWLTLSLLLFFSVVGFSQSCSPTTPSESLPSESISHPESEPSTQETSPERSKEPTTEPSIPDESVQVEPAVEMDASSNNDVGQEPPLPESEKEEPPEPNIPATWAVALGQDADDILGTQIVIDATQHIFIAGRFRGKTRLGNRILQAPNDFDGFVSKLSPQGQVLWTLHLAGKGLQDVRDLHVLPSGDLLVTGNFTQELKVATQSRVATQGGCFLFRVTPQGSMKWFVQAGGMGADLGQALVSDAQDNIYLLGSFTGTSRFGTFTITQNGLYDLFVAKLDSSGTFQWVTTTQGSATSTATDLTRDSKGNLYLVGQFVADIKLGTLSLESNQADMVLAKLSPKGDFLWAKATSGDGLAVPHHILLDTNQNLTVIGEVEGSKVFGSTKLQQPRHGDIFVTQLNTKGEFLWVKKNTGTNVHIHPYGASQSPSGHIVIAGEYDGKPTFDKQVFPMATEFQAFFLAVSPKGEFLASTTTQHSKPIHGRVAAHDSQGNLYLLGEFVESAQFDKISLQPGGQQTYMFVWKRPPLIASP